MAVIKQISVYDGSAWNTDDVGVNDASNVDLQTIVNGQNNVQGALSSLVGTGVLASNKPVETGSDGKLTTAQTTTEKVVVTDTNGRLIDSDVTTTEINTLSGIGNGITVLKDVLNVNDYLNHNNIYRGVCLFNGVSSQTEGLFNQRQLAQAIKRGDFSNIYIGDYIRIITNTSPAVIVNLYVAGIDWYFEQSSVHHLLLTPDWNFSGGGDMNITIDGQTFSINFATKVYNSIAEMTATSSPSLTPFMWYNLLRQKAGDQAYRKVFCYWGNYGLYGDGELAIQRFYPSQLDTTIPPACRPSQTNATTAAQAINLFIDAMTEIEVFGNTKYSSSTYDNQNTEQQLPLFKLNPQCIRYGDAWWTKSFSHQYAFVAINEFGKRYGVQAASDTNKLQFRPLIFYKGVS